MNVDLRLGCVRDQMPGIPDASVDAVISDPIYPEIDREYGRITEAEWHDLMRFVVGECRRILKPHGSAVFVLQPNSEKVGKMRPWLWEFMAWTCREWNQVQDVWWWNFAAPPTVHCHRDKGLTRPSLKACVWLGEPNCYRCQDAVLNEPAEATVNDKRVDDDTLSRSPSGYTQRGSRRYGTFRERGGVTPFNVIPITNGAGREGHPASTPFDLCDWWTRYLSPEGGTVCDPFMGSGTVGLAALKRGRSFVGVERDPGYFATASSRIEAERASTPLLDLIG